MLIKNILQQPEVSLIRDECSEFLYESMGAPIYKTLPAHYGDFARVKARRKRKTVPFGDMLNQAFMGVDKLFQRAVFSFSTPPIPENNEQLYYIFPINGYKYLYSTEVTDSSTEYKTIIDIIFKEMKDSEHAAGIITDLLKYNYTSNNLQQGLSAKAEVIFYKIPYYYAMKVSHNQSYDTITNHK